MSPSTLFAFAIHQLSAVALLGITGGVYLLVRGLLLLGRRQRLVNYSTTKVCEALSGMVEVAGNAAGPYTICAPITGEPCFLYQTIAWQRSRSRKNAEWEKIAEECQSALFFLRDNTGQILVDAKDAELDLVEDFRADLDLSVPLDTLAVEVSAFLARHVGMARSQTSTRAGDQELLIRIEERTIKPNDVVFVVGTVTEDSAIARKQCAAAQPGVPITAGFAVMGRDPGSPDLAVAQGFMGGSEVHDLRAARGPSLEQPESAPEIVWLSDTTRPANAAEMTQQGRIAAALTKAGIRQSETWEAAGISSQEAENQPTPQISRFLVGGISHGKAESGQGLAPLVLRKCESNPTLLVSWQSRREAIRSLRRKTLALVCGGGGLILASVYVLLSHLGKL